MPSKYREKTRVQHLAEALTNLETVGANLSAIDLRTMPKPLRDNVKVARELSDQLGKTLVAAIRADVPTAP